MYPCACISAYGLAPHPLPTKDWTNDLPKHLVDLNKLELDYLSFLHLFFKKTPSICVTLKPNTPLGSLKL